MQIFYNVKKKKKDCYNVAPAARQQPFCQAKFLQLRAPQPPHQHWPTSFFSSSTFVHYIIADMWSCFKLGSPSLSPSYNVIRNVLLTHFVCGVSLPSLPPPSSRSDRHIFPPAVMHTVCPNRTHASAALATELPVT